MIGVSQQERCSAAKRGKLMWSMELASERISQNQVEIPGRGSKVRVRDKKWGHICSLGKLQC